MKYIACVLTFYAVLGLGSVAPAQHCPPPSRIISIRPLPHAVHHAPVVVKKDVVVVKEVVPVVQRFVAVVPLVDFPSYSAVYTPAVPAPVVPVAPQPAQPVAQPDQMKAVLDALKAIDARLQKLEAGRSQVKPKDPFNPQAQRQDDRAAPPAALAVVQNKCAACHSAKDAGDKGAGLALLAEDGKLAALADKAARKVVGRSYAGTMPPKDSKVAALTDEEVAALVAHYTK